MGKYTVHINDKNWLGVNASDGTTIAVLDNLSDVEIEKSASRADKITFDVARDDAVINHLRIGRIVRVYREDVLETSGIIIGPLDKEENPIRVSAIGKGEMLNWLQTPANFRLKTFTPASQVNELLTRYKFHRQNTFDDFTLGTVENTELLSVAPSTPSGANNWYVILATTSITAGGTAIYATQGTFTAEPINVGTIAFNRLRYKAELGNETDMSVQVRGGVGIPTVWGSWTASAKQGIDEDRTELGITTFNLGTVINAFQARFLFTTTNTIFSPALRAWEVVGTRPIEIAAGTLALPKNRKTYTFSFRSHLECIKQIASDNYADIEVTSGYTLHVNTAIGTDKSNSILFEAFKNTNISRYEEDDITLTNEVFSLGGVGSGLTEMLSSAQSTTSIRKYGRRQGIFNAVGTTLGTIQAQATSRLTETKDPLLQVSAEYVNVPPPKFRFGDSVRFRSPDNDTDRTLEIKLKRISEDDDGEIVGVDFEQETDTLTRSLSNPVNKEHEQEVFRGSSGSSGSQGSSGTAGSSGSAGSSGTAGTSGTSGDDGTSGSSGSSGSSPPSDRRLKKNIVPTEINALALLSKIDVRDFDWRSPDYGTHRMTGLIAQEAFEVVPAYVGTSANAYWTVAYGELVPILIKAIQELKAEIKALKGI